MVGGAVIDRLRGGDRSIRALARDPKSAQAERPYVLWTGGDLRDPESLRGALEGCDVAVLCAGIMSSDPGENFAVNRDATRILLDEAVREGVRRFVYVSSTAVYGDADHCMTDEAAPLSDDNPYARSKIEAERIVLEVGRDAPIHPCVFRPCMITGEGDRNLAPALRELVRQPVVPLPGHGRKRLDLVAASDVASAIIKGGIDGTGGPGPYNLTGGNPRTLREILEQAAENVGTSPQWRSLSLEEARQELAAAAEKGLPPPIPPPLVGIASFDWTYSIERARRELAYEPRASIHF